MTRGQLKLNHLVRLPVPKKGRNQIAGKKVLVQGRENILKRGEEKRAHEHLGFLSTKEKGGKQLVDLMAKGKAGGCRVKFRGVKKIRNRKKGRNLV